MIASKSSIKLTIAIGLLISQAALADRAERSERNREEAEQWCAEYRDTHPGKQCRVVKNGKLCPRGYRTAKRCNKIRSRGYKACIRGSKAHGIKDLHNPKKATNLGARGIKQSVRGTSILHQETHP